MRTAPGPAPGADDRAAPPPAGIRAVVAASVRLYRDGLAESLRETMEVVAVSADASDALRAATAHTPDVMLLDLSMEGGLPLVRTLADTVPAIRVVAFAVDDRHDDQVLACAEAGAAGWIGRDASADDVVRAVRLAARGELACSARTAALLTRRVALLARERAAAPRAAALALTPRESEVGALLSRGHSNKHIARVLGVQLATVKNHVHSILEKLGVRSRGEAGAVLRERS